jgi:hypothetical protein
MWQPIETAPKGYAKVLVWDGVEPQVATMCEGGQILAAGPAGEMFFDAGHGEPVAIAATHWMPLPDPPQG